jgi:transposase-like protein
MAQRVAGGRGRRKPPPVSRARRRAQQQAVRRRLGAAVAAVLRTEIEAALEAEVTALLGRAWYARRGTAPLRPAGVCCSRCGQDWAPRLVRAGHYTRTLLTALAAVEISVPRVGCRCRGTVPIEFATLGRYERIWGDLQERARQVAGLCLSLRDAREVLAWDNGQPVACSTLQGWGHQAAPLAAALQQGPLTRVPPVVLLDGLWVKLMVETGARYRDRQGRDRPRVRRETVPLLVAYGVDPATGERWILDWERGQQEDEASWRGLLERLWARGLRADAGLELFIHDGSAGLEAAFALVNFGPGVLRQRCIFHVLQNVRDAVRGTGLTRPAKRERRRAVLQAAAPIWQATAPGTVRQRWQAFREQWQAEEPEAVAVIARVWEATLAYLTVLEHARERGETWAPQYLRTTSALERVNRALRQKTRQVGTFQSATGLMAALALVLAHRRLGPDRLPTDLWTEVLEAGLLAA